MIIKYMKKVLFGILFILILIGFVSSEMVEYFHADGSTNEDCFGGTCLSMPIRGPVYATSGESNWGCGPCDDVSMWVGKDMTQLAKKAKCIGGMRYISGVNLCLETDSGEKWDIIFNTWSSAGSNEFGYVRSNENIGSAENNKWNLIIIGCGLILVIVLIYLFFIKKR